MKQLRRIKMNKNRTIEELKTDEYNEAVGYYKNHAIIRFLNIEHWACLNIPEEFFEPLEMFLPENLEPLDTVFTQNEQYMIINLFEGKLSTKDKEIAEHLIKRYD